MSKKTLRDYMPDAVQEALLVRHPETKKIVRELPTYHSNCQLATGGKVAQRGNLTCVEGGIARPGKTAKDRAKRERRE